MRTGLRELYLKRLLSQALRYKFLLGLTLVAGMINVALTFVIPWLIGTAIDRVTAPDWGTRPAWVRYGPTAPPTFQERSDYLWTLVAVGSFTALTFGVIGY